MLVIFSVMFLAPFSLLAQFDFPTVFGDNLALAAGIVAFVMPPLIDVINRRALVERSESDERIRVLDRRVAAPGVGHGSTAKAPASALDGAIGCARCMIVFVGAITLHR